MRDRGSENHWKYNVGHIHATGSSFYIKTKHIRRKRTDEKSD